MNGSFGVSIFYYEEDVSRWGKDNDFQEHHINKMNLDGDKKDELIDTLGTQDPYVVLYRWNYNVNQFEAAHIALQTSLNNHHNFVFSFKRMESGIFNG
ncbi:hypothetical protein LJR153_003800 [Paenibacillus sp. LjRoot153]|uniref:hypothetical protein n=1 Tax=Paenibacillus sp. LjRoot153 TaxID=3342270 RepID=UPI003ECF7CA8